MIPTGWSRSEEDNETGRSQFNGKLWVKSSGKEVLREDPTCMGGWSGFGGTGMCGVTRPSRRGRDVSTLSDLKEDSVGTSVISSMTRQKENPAPEKFPSLVQKREISRSWTVYRTDVRD